MDANQFWEIIRNTLDTSSDHEKKYQTLVETLARLEESELVQWCQIASLYRNYSYKEKLWGAARILCYGYSEEAFDHFLGWLVEQGKEIFLNALKEPDSLADVAAVREYAQKFAGPHYLSEAVPSLGEHLHFKTIVRAAFDTYQKMAEPKTDFTELVRKFPLPEVEAAAIISEIQYAKDMDTEWYTLESGVFGLDKWLPHLYKLFGSCI